MRQRKEKATQKAIEKGTVKATIAHVSKKGKTSDKVSCVKERKNRWQSVIPQKIKKGNTADNVPCLKNIYNRKITLLTMCHAPNSKLYKNMHIHNHEI